MRHLVSAGFLYSFSLLEESILRNAPQHRNWISRMRLPAASAMLALAAVLVLAAITTQSAQAQTFTLLYSFPGGAVGGDPYAGLVQGTDGNLYGTTQFYGTSTEGTVFNITPNGAENTLHSFCLQNSCTDGSRPDAALVLGTDGNFYGTTSLGGSSAFCANSGGCGTVFRITPSGGLSLLYNFCSQSKCADGFAPNAALTLGSDGNFYGTTTGAGPVMLASTLSTVGPSSRSLLP